MNKSAIFFNSLRIISAWSKVSSLCQIVPPSQRARFNAAIQNRKHIDLGTHNELTWGLRVDSTTVVLEVSWDFLDPKSFSEVCALEDLLLRGRQSDFTTMPTVWARATNAAQVRQKLITAIATNRPWRQAFNR